MISMLLKYSDYFKEVFIKEIDCKDKPTMRSIFGINGRIVFLQKLIG